MLKIPERTEEMRHGPMVGKIASEMYRGKKTSDRQTQAEAVITLKLH